ncbi:MAG: tetratricopeptide repeat-containing serine protease family protein [Solidesulfovibrio sp.]|uniref:tetratricopeptide repeat-containing serine protease family protein n=1 Tax=Solidesulfovibrio sp. TaxID=2910990 RepID=UPI00315899F4
MRRVAGSGLAWPTLVLAALLGAWPGGARADFDEALKAYGRGDDAAALRELAPLVRAGSPSALCLLGAMREAGRGGPRDAAEAARLYRRAADGGNVPALVALAELTLRGDGLPQSDARAGELLSRAAQKGSARALYLLGAMRLDNRGGPAADAPRYLRRAVAAGSAQAALTLGELLLAGRLVPRDPAEAYRLALEAKPAGPGEAALRPRLDALAEAARKQLDPTVALAVAAKAGKTAGPDRPPKDAAADRLATGTGFVVSRLGHVLTCAHVVEGCGRIVARVGGKGLVAGLVRVDRQNDLALLVLTPAPPRALTFREGEAVAAGEPVFAAGYPGRAAISGQLRITAGRTRTLAEEAGPRGGQAITADVLPGNSGGPLLDASGHVAGVVSARRDTARAREHLGDAPAEMGFVVPLATVKAFLSRGQTPTTSAPAGRRLDGAALDATASETVLPLFCLPKGR